MNTPSFTRRAALIGGAALPLTAGLASTTPALAGGHGVP